MHKEAKKHVWLKASQTGLSLEIKGPPSGGLGGMTESTGRALARKFQTVSRVPGFFEVR